MGLPDPLQPFHKEAQHLLINHCVQDIEFSRGTYQIKVVDDDEVWTFFQFDSNGYLQDLFCSCEQSEAGGCAHLAAALLRIYNGHHDPLHKRYEGSLWNILCRSYADTFGTENDKIIKDKEEVYKLNDLFTIKSTDLNKLKSLFEERIQETEKTSIKFSNLSEDEIEQWREGRPSFALSYELSFWTDLAKWMMLKVEDGEKYSLTFEEQENTLPRSLEVSFPNLTVQFSLPEKILISIIPSLDTVESPLKVYYPSSEDIADITYADGVFHIKHTGIEQIDASVGVPIGGWMYRHGQGFFAIDHHLLIHQDTLTGSEISQALNEFGPTLKKMLKDVTIHSEKVTPSYTPIFDDDWNLHLQGYIFEKGDLQKKLSRVFNGWVYLEDDGFYKLEKREFDQLEMTIPQEEVSRFVRQHRTWFNGIEGYKTHLADVEGHLTFHLDEEDTLYLTRVLAKDETGSKDFGSMVFIPGEGFYSKAVIPSHFTVRPGTVISVEEIPEFIRKNYDDLNTIPKFFSDTCPIEHAAIHLDLAPDQTIKVTPRYTFKQEYEKVEVRIFGEYSYVHNEGFYLLPGHCRIPEEYLEPTFLEGEHVYTFLSSELDAFTCPVVLDPRLQEPKEFTLFALEGEQIQSQYHLKLVYQTEIGRVPITQLISSLQNKQRYCFSRGGLIDLESEQFMWLRMLADRGIERRHHTLLLSAAELLRINAFEEIHVLRGWSETNKKTRDLIKRITTLQVPSEPNLKGLTSELRHYQYLGVQWLWSLFSYDLSGLLCDDMGLGKTHQAMALMAAIANKKESTSRYLIVCPTSVIYHWQEKIATFLPRFEVCVFHGIKRELIEEHEIILTSYGIVRREKHLLSNLKFDLAIYDEIQVAKNHLSAIHQALVTIQADMTIGLTGTPIENQIRELKSLFDIVLPGYMFGDTRYNEFFVKPIEKQNDQHKKLLLSKTVSPFMLRRRKKEVLKELPEKIEEVSHCDLTPKQRELYYEVLHQSRRKIIDDIEKGDSIPFIHIFALLTRLKQICDHPAAYWKVPQYYRDYDSGKWSLFVEYLNEARESRQKVVVFSHYLSMLDIIENYLSDQQIGYAAIRGVTKRRDEEIKRFNTDPHCEVFVASLQAAGLGIDLTAGSVVIHYDRWWNAAREQQATDRVHRIGQKRGVQVFKFVTKGTFEERIDELITKKGMLMEEIVGADDHRFLKSFDRNEILELLKF